MRRLVNFVALAAVIGQGAAAQSGAPQAPRAVVELFTSQGCSSCPAADKVLSDIARDPSVIALSLNVDYWDYLGWRDTLALHGHSNRQRAYAGARGDRNVFTPQAVINGTAQVIGSDKAALETAIAQARAAPLPVTIKVEDGKILVTLPAARDEQKSGEVWLCPVTSKANVAVGRGENGGRQLTYTNVVRRWIKLGDWNGEEKTFSASVADLGDANIPLKELDRVAVVLQAGIAAKPGRMLGAAVAALK